MSDRSGTLENPSFTSSEEEDNRWETYLKLLREDWIEARDNVGDENFPLSDPTVNSRMSTLHRITLSYLVHHGYTETAEAFARATDQTITEPIESINNRQRIQRLVLTGRIGDAIEVTRELYPSLLERNKELLFELKCRQFVEMFVELGKNCTTKSARTIDLPPLDPEDTESMDVEESTPTKNDGHTNNHSANNNLNNNNNGTSTDSVTLQKILDFGKELCELEKFLKDPEGRLKKVFFNACALLAYSNPAQSPMSYLLSPSEREPVYAVLNSAILESQGDSARAPLETCLAHCKQVVKLMAKNGLGSCAFADLDAVLN